MQFSVSLIGLIFVSYSAFADTKKSTFDIKDNGEHCQALIDGSQTRVDIFADKQNIKNQAVIIQESAVLHQSSVDGLCMLTGAKSI